MTSAPSSGSSLAKPGGSFAPLRVGALRSAYASGATTPAQVVAEIACRIGQRGDDGVWISVDLDAAAAAAAALGSEPDPARVLWGVPFAVKDNIDVEGWATTAGCPGFEYVATTTATTVQRLLDAGAILVGKTNLDQFATGLNGTRSPYGVPRSVSDPAMISGGSSSGSAVAVAAGLVAFALGTDTAGSGRVPAALNGIVGHKPSRGLLSTAGVVPACQSLDCVNVFAHTVAEATSIVEVAAGLDPDDPWTRSLPSPAPHGTSAQNLRLAIPADVSMLSSVDAYDESWSVSVAALREAGAELVEVDLSGFIEAGELLYEGPWLAERLAGTADFLDRHPDEVHPVVRALLERGRAVPGLDVFRGVHRLRRLRRDAHDLLASVDALLTPTVSTTFTVDEMLDRPIERNTELGRFTTFGNLLDLAIVAIPAKGGRPDRPFGVSIVACAGQDARVAGIAEALESVFANEVAALEPTEERPAEGAAGAGARTLAVAVVGAHLSGMPLHGELVALAATLRETTVTAPAYRLYALETTPVKPGLVRVDDGGERIAVEVYDLPIENVGAFLAGIPSPLGLGTVVLEDGTTVHGFLCEQVAVADALDVTGHGGWRAYMASR